MESETGRVKEVRNNEADGETEGEVAVGFL